VSTTTITGRLHYLGWFNRPWTLETTAGNVDLWPVVEEFLLALNGQRASHQKDRDGYWLAADSTSTYRFNYEPDKCVSLDVVDGFGFSNVHAYMDSALIWLSGRLVIIEIDAGMCLHFRADESEQVFSVQFGDSNSCEVPEGAERSVCKVGEPDCCVFLACGAKGFSCEKFSGPTARVLLDRLAQGTIRATRIGSCAVNGRKEKPKASAA